MSNLNFCVYCNTPTFETSVCARCLTRVITSTAQKPPEVGFGLGGPVFIGGAAGSVDNYNRGSCRGNCGFHGSEDRLWYCSSCFKLVKDEPFLLAVISTAQNKLYYFQKFFDCKGDLYRKLTFDEAKLLKEKLHVFVMEGAGLYDLAVHYDSQLVLTKLIEIKEEEKRMKNDFH